MYNYGFNYPTANMNKFGQAATAFSAFVNHLAELKRHREQGNRDSLRIALENPDMQLQAAPGAKRRGLLPRMFGDEYANQDGQPVVEIGGTPFTASQRPTIAQMFPAITTQRYAQLAPLYQNMIANPANQQLALQGMRSIDDREAETTAREEQAKRDFNRAKELLRLRIEGHERIATARRGGRGPKENETGRWYLNEIRKLQKDMAKGGEGKAEPYEIYLKGLKPGEKPRSKEDYATDKLMEQQEIEPLESYNTRKGLEDTNVKLIVEYGREAVRRNPELKDEVEEILKSYGYTLGDVDEMEDELELDPEDESSMPKILDVREK